ncbi:MAG: hypothetical protein J07HX64_02571 [halophilic archaeon J07HX64]|jgi:hypothetical protein|nr:MAG: hypothetical protein J07HX64_02571 [halophilic archaeon J07HX64]
MSAGNRPLAGVATLPAAKYAFVGILTLLLVIAVGQLYLLGGFTELYLGVPLWLWLQLAILTVMLGLAWVATSVWTTANEESTRETRGDDGGRDRW